MADFESQNTNIHFFSEINVLPIKPRDGLVAFASLVYNKSFYFGSIGIHTKPQGGYRLTYPTRKSDSNNFGIFYPINREVAEEIQNAIISKFEDVTKGIYDRSQ